MHRLPVGTFILDIVDDSRVDPLGGTGGPRRFTAQVWFPLGNAADAAATAAAPLCTPGIAALGAERFDVDPEVIRLARGRARAAHPEEIAPGHHPAVLYSPGRGDPAWTGTSVCEDLAADGCLVVGLSHSYDSPVEYADGHVLPMPADLREMSNIEQLCTVRADDLSMVIGELSGRTSLSPLSQLADRVDPSAIGAFGHSLGGAAAAELARRGAPVAAVADLDGRLWGDVVRDGVDTPFLLLSASRELDDELTRVREGARAGGTWLTCPGASHYSFTEVARRASEWDLARRWEPYRTQAYFGSCPPAQAAEVTSTVVREFMSGAFAGRLWLPDPGLGLGTGWRVDPAA